MNELPDWYQRYSGVRDFINQYVKREDTILNVGCGNSRLTEDMFEDGDVFFLSPFNILATLPILSPWLIFLGYSSITNIDISRVVIEQMMERYREKPTLQWQVRIKKPLSLA